MANVSAGLAFLAGLASFLSPCVFGLIPAYVGYLSGRSIARLQQEGIPNRLETFLHGVAFVLGFSLVFLTLGLALSAVGSLLYDLRIWIARLGGIIVVLLGLHMTGLLRIQWLEYDLRPRTELDRRRSLLSSALLGVSFSAGWSPCIGPVLGMILTLAINQGSISNGLFLLGMYSLGLAIPFLAAALGIGWVVTLLRRYRKVMHYAEIAMGVIMIGVGILLFLGIFNQLAQFGFFVDLGL
ncbi:cytochrome c biogenesis protein CcdA [uncultured Thermanaerothrix sp.]|uniref:cytochrome c biogenesis CcdA family protein n=1 Tax=uncultured Thermanaerothrix sp. TaxID=1195149 RepID=UPI00260EF6D0|nr:cytochrome c biogenesis protein CcdA [uncultured Thermanaerothrix sp.]